MSSILTKTGTGSPSRVPDENRHIHDALEEDVALDLCAHGVRGVVRLHLADQSRHGHTIAFVVLLMWSSYTYAAIVEYDTPRWSVRFGEALMSTVANGIDMDWHISRARAENVELELRPVSGLAIRLLG